MLTHLYKLRLRQCRIDLPDDASSTVHEFVRRAALMSADGLAKAKLPPTVLTQNQLAISYQQVTTEIRLGYYIISQYSFN
jgi:hypothetical protein